MNWVRDQGARASWGTGATASVTMWLRERDDQSANPVAIGIYKDNIAINFDFVRERRQPEQMHRLAEVMRSIPGVASYIQGLERQNWGMHRGMKPADVLGTPEALDAWRNALLQASAPA